ncbi:hypothetical protein QQX98_001332 [Neonectria punicea]|uniref:Heterokaryon incompatibility domain-containing protein n=1 Tax=Neonectria punicea TaxID=979145 RepID=A0ABR1HPD2_9HYPO
MRKSAEEGCAMCGIIADVLDASLPLHPCKSNSTIYDEDAYWFPYDRDAGDDAEASPLVKINLLDSPDRTRLIVRYKGYWLFKRIVKVTELEVLPTRTIHVGDETSEPFLLEAKGTKAPYCVLSYCWGTSPTLKTTKRALQSHKTSIPLHSLPLTIRDGILATRALGFQYLWVDALCIIQDDEEDWGREAAQMGDIYSKATITLSSLVSSDAADGFFGPRQTRQPKSVPLPGMRLPKISRRREQDVTVVAADTVKSPSMCVLVPHWLNSEAPRKGPVHSRGWTLQEQVLSTRKLYFGAGLLRWECQAMHTTEAAPVEHLGLTRIIQKPHRAHAGTYERSERRKQPFALRMFGLGPPGTEHLIRPIAFSIWKVLLMEYTTDRSLTRSSDRLPAFLGVSTFMASHIGSRFIGGLWDGEWFAESLCWAVKTPVPASTTTSSQPPDNAAATAVAVTAAAKAVVDMDITSRRARDPSTVCSRLHIMATS